MTPKVRFGEMQRVREERPEVSPVVDESRLDGRESRAADRADAPSRAVALLNSTDNQDVELLLPLEDVSDPEVSIVIPAVNEELTISDFVEWCKEGLATAGVRGEILIVDSSVDRTAEIALAHNARVLKTPKRGLGRAY